MLVCYVYILDVFPDKQLYIVFEFADCGRDLESYQVCMNRIKNVYFSFGMVIFQSI